MLDGINLGLLILFLLGSLLLLLLLFILRSRLEKWLLKISASLYLLVIFIPFICVILY